MSPANYKQHGGGSHDAGEGFTAGRHWWADPAEVGVEVGQRHHNVFLNHAEACMEAARIEQSIRQQGWSEITPEQRVAAFERTYRWVAQAEDARYIGLRLEEHRNPEAPQKISSEMVAAYHQFSAENPHLNVRLEPERTDLWVMPDDTDYRAFMRGETWNVDTDDIDVRGLGESWSLVVEDPESLRAVMIVDDRFDYGGLSQPKDVAVGVVQQPAHYNCRAPEKTPDTWETGARVLVEFDEIQIDSEGFATDSTTETDWSQAIEAARTSILNELPARKTDSRADQIALEQHAALSQSQQSNQDLQRPGL